MKEFIVLEKKGNLHHEYPDSNLNIQYNEWLVQSLAQVEFVDLRVKSYLTSSWKFLLLS